MSASVKTISIIVAANIKGLEKGMGKAGRSLAKIGSQAARMGSLLSFGVTAPLAALGKSAMDTFVQFESGMAKVNAVTGATQKEFQQLTESAKNLGSTTRFTAQQVADLQLVLGRKGFDPSQIIAMEDSILKLATATGEDLSLAADVTASSLNAFNLESHEAGRVANVLASAAANSSIQLSTFSTAFGHAGASANALGIDIEQLSAMMGVLMDNGIKASKAGTGLRKVFMKLNEQGIPFEQTLKHLADGTMDLDHASSLVGATAANQLLILAKNEKQVRELTRQYKTNTGELDKMNDIMTDTTEHKLKIMQSAIEGLKLEFGGLISEAITPIIKKITDLAKKFTNLDDETKNLIINVGGFLSVLGPVLIGFGALVSMLNPITGGLLALGAAFVAFNGGVSKSESLIEKENRALNNLVDKIKSTTEGTQERFDLITELQEKYPDFLSNLDAEKVSNDDLTKSLKLHNKEFLKKLQLQSEQEKIQELLNQKTSAGKKLTENETKAFEHLRKIKEKYNVVTDETKSAQEQLNDLLTEDDVFTRTKFDDLTVSMLNGKRVSESLIDELSSLKLQLELNNTEFQDSSTALDDYLKLLDELGSTAGKVTSPNLSNSEGGTGGTGGRVSTVTKNLQQTYDAIFGEGAYEAFLIDKQLRDENLADFQRWKNQKQAYLQDLTLSFIDMTSVIVNSGEPIIQSLTKMFNEIGKQIGAMIVKALLLAAVFAMFPGFGGGKLFGGATKFKGILGSLMGGSLEGRASGGPVMGSTPYMVGEVGPELFVPGQSGTIIPNHALGGGGSVIPDVRISGDDLLIVFDRANRRKQRR